MYCDYYNASLCVADSRARDGSHAAAAAGSWAGSRSRALQIKSGRKHIVLFGLQGKVPERANLER